MTLTVIVLLTCILNCDAGLAMIGLLRINSATRVVYKSRQPANFTGFSARFCQLLSLLHESRYVKEMMFIRSHNCLLFTKLQLLKNLRRRCAISGSNSAQVEVQNEMSLQQFLNFSLY